MAENPFSGVYQEFSQDTGYAPAQPQNAPQGPDPSSGSGFGSFWDSLGLGRGGSPEQVPMGTTGGYAAGGRPVADPTDPAYYPRAANPQGSLTGFVDHLRGVPTQDQVNQANEAGRYQRGLSQQQDQNSAEGGLIQDFAKFAAANPNVPPNVAIQKFVTSPEFSSKVMAVPGDRMLKLIEGMKSATSPQQVSATAGTSIMQQGGDGNFRVAGTAPTKDMTENAALLNMSEDDVATIKRRSEMLNPQEAKTQTERATAEMLRLGIIDNAKRLELNSSGKRIHGQYDALGRMVGAFENDRITGRITPIPFPTDPASGVPAPAGAQSPFPPPGQVGTVGGRQPFAPVQPQGGAQPAPLGGQPPAQQAIQLPPGVPPVPGIKPIPPDGKVPEGYTRNGPNTMRPKMLVDMVDGAGVAPIWVDNAGRLTSQGPGTNAQDRFSPELNKARLDLTKIGGFFDQFMKTGREFKSETSKREFLSLNAANWLDNPAVAVNKLSVMRDIVETTIKAHEIVVRTPHLYTAAVISESGKEHREAMKLSIDLPSRQELAIKAAEIKAGYGPTYWEEARRAVPGISDIGMFFDKTTEAVKAAVTQVNQTKAAEKPPTQDAAPQGAQMTAEQYNALPEQDLKARINSGEVTPEIAAQIRALRASRPKQ